MSWLKDVVVDIAAVVLVTVAVLTSNGILSAFLWGYTGVLLFVKLLVMVGNDVMNLMNKAKSEAPEWFTHLLYAINTAVLLYFQWWYTGGCWALIWILSYLAQRKLNTKTA